VSGAGGVSMADVYQPESLADPYPLYHRVRAAGPVRWDDRLGAWMLTGYDAVLAALRDPRFSARRPQWTVERLPEALRETLARPVRSMALALFATDPPDHTRVRALMARAFTPRAVEGARRVVEQVGAELLDAARARGGMDVVRDYAYALPAIVMSGMLGMAPEDRGHVFRWILSYGLLLDGGMLNDEDRARCLAAVAEFLDYFAGIVERRASERRDDVLQTFVDAYDRGEFSGEDELLGSLIFLVIAGQITTTHMIGNSLLQLMRHPEQYAALRDDPGLMAAALHEFLRYDCSVQMTHRRPLEALELGGCRMEAGDEVYVWMAAANRDPAQFPDPDRFDIRRDPVRNLTFGQGIHYCLGAPLGQLVLETGVRLFLERVPSPRADLDRVKRSAVPMFRGVHSFPIELG
jgi:cytochrome P450